MENGILVEYKNEMDQEEVLEEKKLNYQKWVPQNVAEYFFFDDLGYVQISDKRVEDCYKEFTETIRIIYNNTKIVY